MPIALGRWHNSDIEQIAFDVDAARAILEEAGYTWDGEGRLVMPAK